MRFSELKKISVFKKSATRLCAVAGFFFVLTATHVYAGRGAAEVAARFMPQIDQAEGRVRMANFRQLGLAGDYCFKFELEHLPRRGKSVIYSGTLWGAWNASGPVSRFELTAADADPSIGVIELIVQNGSHPSVWLRRDASQEFEQVRGEALFEPIIAGVLYTPFDLQMPFIYWNEFVYEGPGRVLSRTAQWFRMLPPEESAASKQLQAVRIGLDDTYDAMLKVELLGLDGSLLSDFKVESFKKVQQQYIVKEITLKDYATRDRTRFQVKAASLGLNFSAAVFDPATTSAAPRISDTLFEEL